MPSLARLLQDHDLGHLRIVAELWGLDLPPGRVSEAADALAVQMLDPTLAVEIAQSLPPRSRRALDELLAGGRRSMGDLTLRYGPLLPVGPGRRDREQPWRDPEAALDGLWYRGFIGMAFFDTSSGPVEFAFIPDDLREVLRPLTPVEKASSLAPSASPALVLPAGGAADDAVTLLAALRRRPARQDNLSPALSAALGRHLVHPESLPLLLALLRGRGVLQPGPLRPDPAGVRDLLAAGREETEGMLLGEWRRTRRHNDLASTPGLSAPKGIWPNDPVASRSAILSHLSSVGPGQWFELEAVIRDLRERHPTFLRRGGDFDSWLLQDARRGRLLHGLSDWEMVEGALLRHVIVGPLHWFGAADLGQDPDPARATHFRLRFDPASVSSIAGEGRGRGHQLRVLPDGRVVVPRQAPLTDRYHVARFAEWLGRDGDAYRYRLTPRALAAASAQGLELRKVEGILESASGRPLPDSLRRAFERWSRLGMEAVLEATVVLRVKDAEILRRLRSDPLTGKYLEETLGPTSARVRRRDTEALLAAAARRGLLIQPEE
jgi:hypothetical protein